MRRLIERVSTLHTTAQTTAIAPTTSAATRGPAASAIAEATRLEIASDSVIIAKSKAKTRPRMWSGTSTCSPNVDSTHCAPPPEVRDEDHDRRDPERRRESERHVRDAEHRERDADRAEQPPVPGAADAMPEERADQGAHAASGHERADADLASVEDVDAEDRDQREHAGGEAEPGLDADQGEHAVIAAGVLQHLDRGVEHLRVLVTGLARLGERPADAPEQQGRDAERRSVDHERRVASEHGGHDAAEAGSDREHRAPERAVQRVRGRQVARVHQVRGRRRRGRVERGAEDRQQREQRVGEPDRARADEQERGAHADPREVADDHQLPPIEPVDEHAGRAARR